MVIFYSFAQVNYAIFRGRKRVGDMKKEYFFPASSLFFHDTEFENVSKS